MIPSDTGTPDKWAFLTNTGPPVFSIPPEHDFLTCIADAFYCPDAPDAIADGIVLTPNRRSARTLKDALVTSARRHDRHAVILPTIMPLEDAGHLDNDPLTDDTDARLLTDDQRRGMLARLIRHWHDRVYRDQADLAPTQALIWARDVATLLDQGDLAGGCDFSGLNQLIEDADLAAHWQDGARFLHLVLTQAWPDWLKDTGHQTRAAHRRTAISSLIKRWQRHPPGTPVWIVGSTGAAPIDRTLMRAVIDLPLGAVVFRGVDTDAQHSDWEHISVSPSHPQHTIKRTLDHLQIAPCDVRSWPDTGLENPSARSRRRLIYEVLAPAAATRDWTSRLAALARRDGHGDSGQFIRHASRGLRLIEADDDTEQAMIAALALRQAAQDSGRTAVLVTPDAALGRRVSCLMRRWQINIAPSQGVDFSRTESGRLLIATVDAALDTADPVALLALLKQPLVRIGRSGDDLKAAVAELELARDSRRYLLRGPSHHTDLNDLITRLEKTTGLAADLIRDVANGLDRLVSIVAASDPVDPEKVVEALADCLRILTAGPQNNENTLDALSDALKTLAEIAGDYGEIPARHIRDFIHAGLATLHDTSAQTHPRLAILGPLEARLQHHDLVILAGLNEKTWPRQASVDGLLPSRLRADLGLPDTEEILGLSAYDFSQMACGSDVLLLRSARSGQTRTVASRWLWRLRKLCQAGTDEKILTPDSAENLRRWARDSRLPGQQPAVFMRPEPRPPLHARPRIISASSLRDLLTDPYVIYARDILGLRFLPPVGSPIDSRLRGTAVHIALETFSDCGLSLIEAIRNELTAAGMTISEWAAVEPLWQRATDDFLAWEENRRTSINRTHREIRGEIHLGSITLKARADRIDEMSDGTVAIIDFKTGHPPKVKEVESGDQPQLPVEALIAMTGGFGELYAKEVGDLIYYRFGTGRPDKNNGAPLVLDVKQATETVGKRLRDCLDALNDPTTPYAPRIEDGDRPSDYDRLSRRAEWAKQ